MWTIFMDMHSGGRQKLDWPYIYIEASKEEAMSVFYSKFGRSPERVTCTCCGEDYSIDESETLEQATAYERGCTWYSAPPKKGERFSKEGRYLEKDEPIPEGWVTDGFSSFRKYQTLEEYLPTVKVIYTNEITEPDRKAYVPEEGYVWR